jgi:hypothetical protein
MKRIWFLSYNSRDQPLTRSVEDALKRKDPDAEIFFAPDSLRAGGYWLPRLAEAIAESTAFVLLVGEHGLGPWQIIEYYEALDKRVKGGYPVILLLSDGQTAPGLPFLRQLHWIVATDPASEDTIGRLISATAGTASGPGKLWKFTAPYRGLASMAEADSEFFFGREAQTAEVLRALDLRSDRIPVLLGNSGVGKSSLAQAGVLAALRRQAWPQGTAGTDSWPHHLQGSRGWYFIKMQPGDDPLRALVEPFVRTWRFDTTDPLRETRLRDWMSSLQSGNATLRGLLDATQHRLAELGIEQPSTFFLYIDQAEELYVRAAEEQRRRFSELVHAALADSRFRALISLRSDFIGFLQRDEPLYSVHQQINVPPLRETELREVVNRPAQLLSARFETRGLPDEIARKAAEDSAKDAGALPLLSYLLDDMWSQMVARDDGILRLPPQAVELGGVLADRADRFLAGHLNAEGQLRRILTLKLASVREEGEPTRRRALRSEFSEDEWKLVSELADYPHRMLVTATPESGETYAEVAHEALFRRWAKLREWIAAEREFLVWKTALERDRHNWEKTPTASKRDALLMGLALTQARDWLLKRPDDLPSGDVTFIEQSIERETADRVHRERLRRRAQWVGAVGLVLVSVFSVFAGYQWQESEAAKNVAVRVQAKYDILKATIRGNAIKIDLDEQRQQPARSAKAVLADLQQTYLLLDADSFDSLLEQGVRHKRIIWFDVAQKNNESEATALRKLGFEIVPTETIPDAVETFRAQRFDLIITHYGFNRQNPDKSNSNAYRLRQAITESGHRSPPMIIYTIGATDEYACTAQKDGFYDETQMPAELIEIAVRAVSGEPIKSRCRD